MAAAADLARKSARFSPTRPGMSAQTDMAKGSDLCPLQVICWTFRVKSRCAASPHNHTRRSPIITPHCAWPVHWVIHLPLPPPALDSCTFALIIDAYRLAHVVADRLVDGFRFAIDVTMCGSPHTITLCSRWSLPIASPQIEPTLDDAAGWTGCSDKNVTSIIRSARAYIKTMRGIPLGSVDRAVRLPLPAVRRWHRRAPKRNRHRPVQSVHKQQTYEKLAASGEGESIIPFGESGNTFRTKDANSVSVRRPVP